MGQGRELDGVGEEYRSRESLEVHQGKEGEGGEGDCNVPRETAFSMSIFRDCACMFVGSLSTSRPTSYT